MTSRSQDAHLASLKGGPWVPLAPRMGHTKVWTHIKCLFLLTTLLRNATFVGSQINQTVDDTLGDSVSGAKVSYHPPHVNNIPVWKSSSSCSDCAVTPDTSQAFDNTWTAAEYIPAYQGMSATFSFAGTAIYIYLIQSNNPIDSRGLDSSTICQFYIDADVVGTYQHVSDGTSVFQYNVLAYSNTSVVDGSHTFVIKTNGQSNSYVIFDYAIYTTGSSTTNSSTASRTPPAFTSALPLESTSNNSTTSTKVLMTKTPTRSIAGGVVGGIVLIALIASALARLRRRDHVQRTRTPFVPFVGRQEVVRGGVIDLAVDASAPSMTDLQRQITERQDTAHKLERRQLDQTSDNSDVVRQVDEIRAQIRRLESQQQSILGSLNGESPIYPSTSDSGLRVNTQSTLLESPPSYDEA